MSKKKKKRSVDIPIELIIIPIGVLLFIFLLLTIIPIGLDEKITRKVSKEEILSLKPDKEISGMFILGSGSINQRDYYYFFLKEEKMNGYAKVKIPADETLIIEKDTVPIVKRHYVHSEKIKRYALKKSDTIVGWNYYGLFNPIPDDLKYEYQLIVPVGTITENVQWDAL